MRWRSTRPSIGRLKFLASFRHAVRLNLPALWEWDRVRTICIIGQVFPMYELTLDGLEAAVRRLVAKNQGAGFRGILMLWISAGIRLILDARKRQGRECPAVGCVMMQTDIKATHP